MPASEIELSKLYKDQHGFRITIDAGKNGWTVIWADQSTNYKDVVATTEENFKEAYDCVVNQGFKLTEIEEEPVKEIVFQ